MPINGKNILLRIPDGQEVRTKKKEGRYINMASGKILIVDDDRNICELLRLYIEKEGFETAIANDGIMLEPKLISQVTTAGGIVKSQLGANVVRRVCSGEIAEILKQYMYEVVESGTGTLCLRASLFLCR